MHRAHPESIFQGGISRYLPTGELQAAEDDR